MQTLFIGKNLIFLPTVHSTNSYATDLLKNVKPPEGTVIYASHQTQGKGQRGALWKANAGQNLTASVILKPVFLDLSDQFFLYQIAALACYDTIAELLNSSQIDIKIKWPNDILLKNKKLAGILIENSIQHNQLNWSVIGIGINVNQLQFDPSIHATSLSLLSTKSFHIEEVLNCMCTHLEKYYLALVNGQSQWIKENYLKHLIGLDVFMNYTIGNEIKRLKITGVSDSGLLMLSSEKDESFCVDVKEAILML